MNIITVRYWGGMGNVMFQIAAAIAYSKKHNRPYVLDKYAAFQNLMNSVDSIEQSSLKEYSEEEITANIPFPENQNVKLLGFFQQYTMFDSFKTELFDIIGIPVIRNAVIPIINSPEFRSRGLFQHLETSSKDDDTEITISLHIRRGDYEQLACYFLLINEYYYKLALLHMMKNIQPEKVKINVLCFYEKKSTESAKNIIKILEQDNDLSHYPIKYHHFNDIIEEQNPSHYITDVEEMAIMSQCKHHIIANSTYSWWSAYINPDDEKMVCYPNEYFNHQLYYLSNEGLRVKGWNPIEAWNPFEYRCACRF